MGLDMYLEKRCYVQNWEHNGPKGQYEITVKKGGKLRADIKPERICYIIEQVAYWRKANAIHAWFVKHVQDGKDDCKSYYVSREQLAALKAACDKVEKNSKLRPGKVKNGWVYDKEGKRDIVEDGEVIVDPQIAETVLPTAEGFFFGGVDYDQGYLDDIIFTGAAIAELLAEDHRDDFYYRASW